MIVIFVILVIVAFIVVAIYQKKTNGVCRSKARLDGKVAIVTGGTAGMGLEIALDFAKRGAKVIIAGPFRDEGEAAKTKIRLQSGNENVEYEFLDLASLKSIRKFANEMLKTELKLDILVNNAGVGEAVGESGNSKTEDGLNIIMQINYFGHFLLTLLLLPLLKKAPSSRIVNQSSVLHTLGSISIQQLNSKVYNYLPAYYANSKLCMILFSKELTKRLKSNDTIIINNTDPGAVATRIFESIGSVLLGKLIAYCLHFSFKTPWEGAQTAIHLAVDESVTVSGELFKNCRLSKPHNKQAFDDELSSKLWEESKKLVQIQDYECEL